MRPDLTDSTLVVDRSGWNVNRTGITGISLFLVRIRMRSPRPVNRNAASRSSQLYFGQGGSYLLGDGGQGSARAQATS